MYSNNAVGSIWTRQITLDEIFFVIDNSDPVTTITDIQHKVHKGDKLSQI